MLERGLSDAIEVRVWGPPSGSSRGARRGVCGEAIVDAGEGAAVWSSAGWGNTR